MHQDIGQLCVMEMTFEQKQSQSLDNAFSNRYTSRVLSLENNGRRVEGKVKSKPPYTLSSLKLPTEALPR